jgi:predicted RNA methylase
VVLPPGQLTRPVYEEVNRVLVTAGGKWDRKTKSHLFKKSPADALSEWLATGQLVNEKQAFQIFDTPDWLADLMVEALDIVPDELVLEPSAGEGQLVKACLRKGACVHAVELRPECEALLVALEVNVTIGNFLLMQRNRLSHGYKACVMNPPFTKGQAIEHVTHAYRFVTAPLRLAAVMPSGVVFGSQRQPVAFREWCTAQRARMYQLPDQTFREAGADVNTVLLVVDRSRRNPDPYLADLVEIKYTKPV